VTQNRTQATRRRLLRAGAGTVIGLSALSGVTAQEGNEQEFEATYAEVYEETIDDVVLVNVLGGEDEPPGGVGSGFVVDDHVVTNEHVVQNATDVEIQFRDEQWRTGEVVGTDVYSDLAVLEVEDLPDAVDGLEFAADQPAIGQEVLAMGNPLGLDASLSQGIVSGLDRSLLSPTGFSIPAAIQTDAPVDPGNSGGPLVTLESDVVGVVFAGAGRTVGFAISAQLADRVVPALADDGEYDHAYMGVGVDPVGPLIAEVNDLEDPQGVLIVDVTDDAPADGVLEPADDVEIIDGVAVPTGGDVVVALDGEEIPNQDQLSSYLALETSPGDDLEVEVRRDGDSQTLELALEERPETDLP